MFRTVRIVFMFLLLGVVACATENTKVPTATAPIPAPINEPLSTTSAPSEQSNTVVPSIQAFEEQLMQALTGRDSAQIRSLMGESFMIAGWRSEGAVYEPNAAIRLLQDSYLGEDAKLIYHPNQDLATLLGGMDPLSILDPVVESPRAMFVSGFGANGSDEALLYIAHRSDGIPYWYGVLVSAGGFAPTASDGEPSTAVVLAIPEASIAIRLPGDQMLMKNTELYRRGSFAAYDFVLPQGQAYPYLAEIQFYSRESIEGFLERCDTAEYPCFYGDYPDVARYDRQKAALERQQPFGQFSLQTFGERTYFVSQHECEGAPCIIREYTSFAGDTKIDVWVMMADGSQAAQADVLVGELEIKDDWSGIGSMPGPLYTLIDPGVTLRQPLNWEVREAMGSVGEFVVRSVSFIPNAFGGADQPQVPAVNVFVYGPPLGASFQDWLEIYSTTAPFGTEAGPETRYFGVKDVNPINTASFFGVQFTHDVLGFGTQEILFAVGQTVMGLSYVDFGPEDMRPAFLQMQSSLTVTNVPNSAERTDVRYVVALKDIRLRRGPDTTFQQIGQVADGQMALVTGVSKDGGWWRVICPNDVIGDCWVSADPQLTQPTMPPSSGAQPAQRTTWTEYRDERYGYGLAVPCHWLRLPPPMEGNFATLTLRSYDDVTTSGFLPSVPIIDVPEACRG